MWTTKLVKVAQGKKYFDDYLWNMKFGLIPSLSQAYSLVGLDFDVTMVFFF
jgi:hypothetical protein